MIYTVTWKQEADDRLAELWMAVSDRDAISAASYEIDRLLRTDPETKGEPESDDRRLLFCPPLIVAYKVSESDRLVSVLSVRLVSDWTQEN